jgi:hypothetical protein
MKYVLFDTKKKGWVAHVMPRAKRIDCCAWSLTFAARYSYEFAHEISSLHPRYQPRILFAH